MMSHVSHTLPLGLRRLSLVLVSQNVITAYLFEVREIISSGDCLERHQYSSFSTYSQLMTGFSILLPSTLRFSKLQCFIKYSD
jgi:hypothetical protein